jgi:hypothetical protein
MSLFPQFIGVAPRKRPDYVTAPAANRPTPPPALAPVTDDVLAEDQRQAEAHAARAIAQYEQAKPVQRQSTSLGNATSRAMDSQIGIREAFGSPIGVGQREAPPADIIIGGNGWDMNQEDMLRHNLGAYLNRSLSDGRANLPAFMGIANAYQGMLGQDLRKEMFNEDRIGGAIQQTMDERAIQSREDRDASLLDTRRELMGMQIQAEQAQAAAAQQAPPSIGLTSDSMPVPAIRQQVVNETPALARILDTGSKGFESNMAAPEYLNFVRQLIGQGGTGTPMEDEIAADAYRRFGSQVFDQNQANHPIPTSVPRGQVDKNIPASFEGDGLYAGTPVGAAMDLGSLIANKIGHATNKWNAGFWPWQSYTDEDVAKYNASVEPDRQLLLNLVQRGDPKVIKKNPGKEF